MTDITCDFGNCPFNDTETGACMADDIRISVLGSYPRPVCMTAEEV